MSKLAIEHVFYINMDSRPDRRASIEKQLLKIPINSTRIPGVEMTVAGIDRNTIKNMNFHYAISESTDMTRYILGALGCRWSHYKCIQQACNKYDCVMILEDDCILDNDAMERINKAMDELPPYWEMLLLAGNHFDGSYSKYSPNLIKISKTFSTLAYIVNASVYYDIIRKMDYYAEEIDVFYCDMIYSRGHSYCIWPHVAKSASGYSDILNKHVDYECINRFSTKA